MLQIKGGSFVLVSKDNFEALWLDVVFLISLLLSLVSAYGSHGVDIGDPATPDVAGLHPDSLDSISFPVLRFPSAPCRH